MLLKQFQKLRLICNLCYVIKLCSNLKHVNHFTDVHRIILALELSIEITCNNIELNVRSSKL